MARDYVTELADQAFREISAGMGAEIEKIVGKPGDAPSLAYQLQLHPDRQAQVASITGYTPSRWLLEQELALVDARRQGLGIQPVSQTGGPYERASDSCVMGLCFSGGGIRSATFNLGVLQGLAELKLLRCFDYLSTVSGGGYIHQWLAAWSKRRGFEEVESQLIPLPEMGNPGAHPEPIRWLRRYSNYLTPKKGILTADTWVAFAVWLRNALLNQIILLSGLLFLAIFLHAVALPQIIPHQGWAVAIIAGAASCLSLVAIYFLGENFWRIRSEDAGGESVVQNRLVVPLTAAAFFLTLLLPAISWGSFGFHFFLSWNWCGVVLLLLALTTIFAGHLPLCYLQTHAITSHVTTVKEFWKAPKCSEHLKFIFAIVGLLLICLLAAIGGATWIAGSILLIAKLLAHSGEPCWRLALVLGPPLILGGPLITMLLLVGLLGRTFYDPLREWLSRVAAWIGMFIVLWIFAFGFSLLGSTAVAWLYCKLKVGIPLLTGWVISTIGGLLAGKSAKSSGGKSDRAPKFGAIELVALVGPYIFLAGLLLLVSALAERLLRDCHLVAGWALLAAFFLAVCLLFAWRVDINEFSLHSFYRNRLARCYLGASNIPRRPNPFTGFDERDSDIALSDLQPSKGYKGPFPIFCTAINLTFGQDLAWQERKAASFAFTPLYSGYDVLWTAAKTDHNFRFNGFVNTATYAYPQPGIHINTAAAVSGAALSPNMGYHTSAATAFLLTLFCVRLGWWLRNPRGLNEDGTKLGPGVHYPWPSPHFSLLSLTRELLGRANDASTYVYLSDGGHFDNMGLYELVRRRCHYIVICDSENDCELKFDGIGMAIRKCRIDFGAEIELDLRPLQHVKDSELSSAHCVVGTIRYPEDPARPGTVVYIKSSLTGDEPADVLNFKKEHSIFPHDSTTNQWFTESQFESYRRLGHHVAFSVFEPATPDVARSCGEKELERRCFCSDMKGRKQFFDDLSCTWWSPTPEMERFAAAHSDRYEALLEKARTDKDLPGFFPMLFGNGSNWKNGGSKDQIEYGVQFSSELIDFIFTVYNQLELVLPEKRNHPYARGWSRIFTNWTKIDVVRDGWARYRDSYSAGFRRYAESDCVGLSANNSPQS
jgi:hypothetical protein